MESRLCTLCKCMVIEGEDEIQKLDCGHPVCMICADQFTVCNECASSLHTSTDSFHIVPGHKPEHSRSPQHHKSPLSTLDSTGHEDIAIKVSSSDLSIDRGLNDSLICSKHNQGLLLYCSDHAELICAICAFGDHKGHNISLVHDEVIQSRKRIDDCLRSISACVERAEKLQSEVHQIQQDLTGSPISSEIISADAPGTDPLNPITRPLAMRTAPDSSLGTRGKMESNIRTQFQLAHDVLNIRQEEMLRELRDMCSHKAHALKGQQESIKNYIDRGNAITCAILDRTLGLDSGHGGLIAVERDGSVATTSFVCEMADNASLRFPVTGSRIDVLWGHCSGGNNIIGRSESKGSDQQVAVEGDVEHVNFSIANTAGPKPMSVFSGANLVASIMSGRLVDCDQPNSQFCSVLEATPHMHYCNMESSLTLQTRSTLGIALMHGGASVVAYIQCLHIDDTNATSNSTGNNSRRIKTFIRRIVHGNKLIPAHTEPTPSISMPAPTDLEVHDNQDGTYALKLRMTVCGVYEVDILVGGERVMGCPVEVLVRQPPQYSISGQWSNMFFSPRGVCCAGGVVYVSDRKGCCIHLFRCADGSLVKTFGTHKPSNEHGAFNLPLGLCLHDDILVVADRGNNRVQVLNRHDGSFISEITGRGGSFDHISPMHVCYYEGHVYVTDVANRCVHVFRLSDGVLIRSIGNGRFEKPTGLCCQNGLLYVSDTYSKKIHMMRCTDGAFVKEFGIELEMCPIGICCSDNMLFLTDVMNQRIHLFDLKGNLLTSYGRPNSGKAILNGPYAVCMDEDGTNMFVTNATSLQRWIRAT